MSELTIDTGSILDLSECPISYTDLVVDCGVNVEGDTLEIVGSIPKPAIWHDGAHHPQTQKVVLRIDRRELVQALEGML